MQLSKLPKVINHCYVVYRQSCSPSRFVAALGAKVIAAAGSAEKIEIAKRYGGADYGVNYSNPGWQKEVLAMTGGKGVDVIYDPVGLINGSASPHILPK